MMKRLHICVPNYRGVVEQHHAMSMYSLFHQLGRQGRDIHYTTSTSTIVQTARQICVDTALADPECSHVLFIDDDMVFAPEHYRMLEDQAVTDDLDFIAALAFSNSYPTKPCIFALNPGFQEWGPEPWWHIITDYPRDQRFEVAASGFGMVLISRRMLEKMKEENLLAGGEGFRQISHFAYENCRNEDVAFCLLARKAGFRLYCDSRIKIGHISKERPLIDEAVYEAQGQALLYASQVPLCRLKEDTLHLEWLNVDGNPLAEKVCA